MKQSIYHRLSGFLWGSIVLLIVLLAVYVSTGRLLTSLTGSFQVEILRELNHRVPFTIDADRVNAEWQSFTPVLVLEGLRVTVPGESERSLELSEGRIALDVAASLLSRTPQMTQVRLNGLQLSGELDVNGKLRIRGFEGGDTRLQGWLEDFVPSVEHIALDGARLELLLPGGEQRGFDLDLALSREGSRRNLQGSLESSRGMKVFMLGEGIGNPLQPESFSGQLYFDIEAVELGAVSDLLPGSLQDVGIAGGLGMELWSNWESGELVTSLRLAMDEVELTARDGSWQVPFDQVALDARLVDREGGWGLSIAALDIVRDEARLQVPRLQLDSRGETLRLRAVDLPLAPLTSLLQGLESLPPTVRDLVRVLQPRGSLQTVQVTVADIGELAAGWQLQAEFDQLAVDPWHGAPGVSGARGYAEVAPGAGFVVLDSHQFSMTFPTVYEHDLHYDDFNGTIYIDWDDVAVVLSSSLVMAKGPEGVVPVLFGLNIPLQASDVGLEMDLLVGLQGTRSIERGRYIPYILDQGLRDWLEDSIGEGLIEQGGFLWRGSLKGGLPASHTVQLFFNIRDTSLRYHAGWPSLTVEAGTVLINDSTVSVWAGQASLLDSEVSELSVEVWVDEAASLWLAVDGSVSGPAADGLAVVNTSPLRQLGGDAFARWQLSGDLQTDIALVLNLNDSSVPPQVDVTARFAGSDLDILPGNLPVRGVNGALNYASATGFSSRELAGQLWGQPLQAVVSQRQAAPGSVQQGVVVDLSSVVDVASLQQWLAPQMPGFSEGRARVSAQLVVGKTGAVSGDAGDPAATRTVLSIDSDLQGVALALPEPWSKPAETQRPLHLDLSLGEQGIDLAVTLAGGLAAQLALVEGQLQSAALAFGGEPAPLVPGQVHIGGQLTFADTTQWQAFLTPYLDNAPAAMVGQESTAPVSVTIEDLVVDQLVLDERELGPVRLNLGERGGHWRLAAETSWLRGEFLYVTDGESRLDIDYLDLAGLDVVAPPGAAVETIIEIPVVAVTITDLHWADQALGELAFGLSSDGADLRAEQITGRLAAMSLPEEEPGSLVWHQGENSRTSLAAELSVTDLGQTLADIGYQKIIETQEGSFDLRLEWPGAPQDFSLAEGAGSLAIDIGKGSFPDAPGGASGALRVVSILNLAEIVQRLSLTHMFESGIPFNSVKGEVLLQEGTIEVPRMEVQGSASSFQFSGVSEVDARSLDGELVVTLPVANNLSWVAALAAGLPVAAGVFVLSKVFETPLNRLTSAVYIASGTWDEPVVSFDRVFDDTPAAGTPAASPDDSAAGQEPATAPAQADSP